MQDQYGKDAAQIDGDLERGQTLGHFTQPGRAAQRHQGNRCGDENAIGPAIGHPGDDLNLREALIDLHHRDRAEQREKGVGAA